MVFGEMFLEKRSVWTAAQVDEKKKRTKKVAREMKMLLKIVISLAMGKKVKK